MSNCSLSTQLKSTTTYYNYILGCWHQNARKYVLYYDEMMKTEVNAFQHVI